MSFLTRNCQPVFDVFGDKEVLERYDEARHHQEHTSRELDAAQNQLEALGNSLEKHEQKVNRYREWQGLNAERTALVSETRPRLVHHLLQKKPKTRGHLAGLASRTGAANAQINRRWRWNNKVQQQALQAAQLQKQAAHENEQVQQRALNDLNLELGGWQEKVKQHDRLLQQAESAGGQAADARELNQLANERDRLRLDIAGLEQQQSRLDEMLENLAGRRTDPADVAAFRQVLNSAGIAHDLLTDLVEIADPTLGKLRWRPCWHRSLTSCCWPRKMMRKRRCRWAKKCATDISSCRNAATPASRREGRYWKWCVSHSPCRNGCYACSNAYAAWKMPMPEARLPRGEDWITRQGHLRERRGGRFAAPEQARFGKARLESLRQQRADLEKRSRRYASNWASCPHA